MNNLQYPFLILFLSILTILSCDTPNAQSEKVEVQSETSKTADYAIVIHGGAGTILKKNMTDEREKLYRDALNAALSVGEEILSNGGTSLEAVEKTIPT